MSITNMELLIAFVHDLLDLKYFLIVLMAL